MSFVEFEGLMIVVMMVVGGGEGTNSNAILRHIARKANPALLGKDLKEQAQIDMLIDVLVDFRNGTLQHACQQWRNSSHAQRCRERGHVLLRPK